MTKNIGNCVNCKYWGGSHSTVDDTCWDGPCALFDQEDGEMAGKLAYIEIDTKYYEFIHGIFFNTFAEFGCIKWESNEVDENRKSHCSCGETPCTCPF